MEIVLRPRLRTSSPVAAASSGVVCDGHGALVGHEAAYLYPASAMPSSATPIIELAPGAGVAADLPGRGGGRESGGRGERRRTAQELPACGHQVPLYYSGGRYPNAEQTRQGGKGGPPRQDLRRYLEAFPEFLEGFTPPAGAFDPHGAWKQSYAVHLFADESGIVGFLELERRPAPDGMVLAAAARLSQMNGFEEHSLTLECAAGVPAPLRSVKIESVSDATRISISGVVRGASIEWMRAGGKRSTPAPPPLVADLALFDAVQRLKPDAKPPEFTLLDDGDLVKPAQRLLYVGETTVKTGGGNVALKCWEQTGYGVLPAHYWVDAQGRLLFAIAGQKAYLYDPEARSHAQARNRSRGRKQA